MRGQHRDRSGVLQETYLRTLGSRHYNPLQIPIDGGSVLSIMPIPTLEKLWTLAILVSGNNLALLVHALARLSSILKWYDKSQKRP